jgi:hypothetical protein
MNSAFSSSFKSLGGWINWRVAPFLLHRFGAAFKKMGVKTLDWTPRHGE